jgi:hypothetical protein
MAGRESREKAYFNPARTRRTQIAKASYSSDRINRMKKRKYVSPIGDLCPNIICVLCER